MSDNYESLGLLKRNILTRFWYGQTTSLYSKMSSLVEQRDGEKMKKLELVGQRMSILSLRFRILWPLSTEIFIVIFFSTLVYSFKSTHWLDSIDIIKGEYEIPVLFLLLFRFTRLNSMCRWVIERLYNGDSNTLYEIYQSNSSNSVNFLKRSLER